MPELRRDPIADRWVIIAENRAERPGAFTAGIHSPASATVGGAHPTFPFCPGNERETPREVFALRNDGSEPDVPAWRVRAVPNKYPALDNDFEASPHEHARTVGIPNPQSLFTSSMAYGVHEVIIDTPRHVTTIVELTDAEFGDSLLAIRARLEALREHTDLKHALVFKNVGRAAGASIEHLHSQLMALDIVPPLVADEIRSARAFFDAHRQCVFCRLVEEECKAKVRILAESPGFLALCPYASRFAYETWILPKEHASHFESIRVADLADLANLARGAIARIERLSQPPAYNLFLHTSPFDSVSIEHYHWHIEIVPRLTIAAGFEWGSGCAVNPVSPERAAATLRGFEQR